MDRSYRFTRAVLQHWPDCRLIFWCLVKPLGQYFHAGRAACVPFFGRLIHRFGGRRVILIGNLIFASTLLSSALISTRIAYLYLFFAALGLVSGGTSPVPYGVVVSRWFDERRGMALGS